MLACTEIPLVMQTGDVVDGRGQAVPLIDTLEALADAALDVHARSTGARRISPPAPQPVEDRGDLERV